MIATQPLAVDESPSCDEKIVPLFQSTSSLFPTLSFGEHTNHREEIVWIEGTVTVSF